MVGGGNTPVDYNLRILYRSIAQQPTCAVLSGALLFPEASVGGLFIWFSEGSRNYLLICSF